MHSFLRLTFVLVTFTTLYYLSVNGEPQEWIEPAFVESLDEVHTIAPVLRTARPWNGAGKNQLAPSDGMHESDTVDHSFAESSTEMGATLEARLGATITAEGKTHAELMTEIEARGPHFFEEFKAKFKRTYKDETKRFGIFMANLVKIAELNARTFISKVARGSRAVYTHLSPHADRTAEEFKSLLNHQPSVSRAKQLPIGKPGQAKPHTNFLEQANALKLPKLGDVCGSGANRGTCTTAEWCFSHSSGDDTLMLSGCDGAAGPNVDASCCVKPSIPPPTPGAPAPVHPIITPSGFKTIPTRAPVMIPETSPPVDVDFRALSTPIKNQQTCVADYAFSSTAALETIWAMKTGQLYTLSPQQVMDCMKGPGACKGGDPIEPLNYWMAHGGAVTEAVAPYLNQPSTTTCITPTAYPPIKPSFASWALSSAPEPKPDEHQLGRLLSKYGPMVVSLDGTSLQFYGGGIMDTTTQCSSASSEANYAVVIEGLGTDASGHRYWIVRNSMGAVWGEQGRARFAFDQNVCGLANWPIFIEVGELF